MNNNATKQESAADYVRSLQSNEPKRQKPSMFIDMANGDDKSAFVIYSAELDRLRALNAKLADALKAICDDAPCAKDMRLFPIVEIMPHLITEARAALATWERHNATKRTDDPLPDEIVGNDTVL